MKTLRTLLLLVVAFAITPLVSSAGGYLKIGDIKGESQDKAHLEWIDIQSWSWGVVSPRDAASGLPTGKRQHKPLVITKEIDKATPLLAQALVQNEVIDEATIELTRRSETGEVETYLIIKMENVRISSFHADGTHPIDNRQNEVEATRETVSFYYNKITWTYVDGGVEFVDDWAENG